MSVRNRMSKARLSMRNIFSSAPVPDSVDFDSVSSAAPPGSASSLPENVLCWSPQDVFSWLSYVKLQDLISLARQAESSIFSNGETLFHKFSVEDRIHESFQVVEVPFGLLRKLFIELEKIRTNGYRFSTSLYETASTPSVTTMVSENIFSLGLGGSISQSMSSNILKAVEDVEKGVSVLPLSSPPSTSNGSTQATKPKKQAPVQISIAHTGSFIDKSKKKGSAASVALSSLEESVSKVSNTSFKNISTQDLALILRFESVPSYMVENMTQKAMLNGETFLSLTFADFVKHLYPFDEQCVIKLLYLIEYLKQNSRYSPHRPKIDTTGVVVPEQTQVEEVMKRFLNVVKDDTISDSFAILDFLESLSQPELFKRHYLSSDYKNQQQVLEKIAKFTTNRKLKEEFDYIKSQQASMSQNRQIPAQVKISLVLLERVRPQVGMIPADVILQPHMRALPTNRKDSIELTIGLLVGPFLVVWDETGFAIPRRLYGDAEITCVLARETLATKSWDEISSRLSRLLCHFNIYFKYHPRFMNAYHFIHIVLQKLDIDLKSKVFGSTLANIKQKGYSTAKWKLSPAMKEFLSKKQAVEDHAQDIMTYLSSGTPTPEIMLDSHATIDTIVCELLQYDLLISEHFPNDFKFLDSVHAIFCHRFLSNPHDSSGHPLIEDIRCGPLIHNTKWRKSVKPVHFGIEDETLISGLMSIANNSKAAFNLRELQLQYTREQQAMEEQEEDLSSKHDKYSCTRVSCPFNDIYARFKHLYKIKPLW